MRIRRERPGDPADVAAVRAVSIAAFPADAEARLLDALRAAGDCDPARSLVAEVDGTVVGHALLTAMILERPDGTRDADRIVALGPVAVTPEWQKRGIGGELVRAALAQAEREGAAAVVLLGHPTYYPRFGFRPAREQGLLPTAPWPDTAWMACRLPAWTPLDAGVVHYARAFMEMEQGTDLARRVSSRHAWLARRRPRTMATPDGHAGRIIPPARRRRGGLPHDGPS